MNILAQHIVKKFAGVTALDDVTIEIPSGKIFGLLGPNGAGKTTFIRILNQIIQPTSGTITIDGNPLKISDVERMGYLPEERGLYRKMRVAEHTTPFRAALSRWPSLSPHRGNASAS